MVGLTIVSGFPFEVGYEVLAFEIVSILDERGGIRDSKEESTHHGHFVASSCCSFNDVEPVFNCPPTLVLLVVRGPVVTFC